MLAFDLRRVRSERPVLVAIVGGSGAGKSWLAARLHRRVGEKAARLSLDDFYRDRSYLSPRRRDWLNFDHPRSIDWAAAERALRLMRLGRTVRVPCYDFVTHCRVGQPKTLRPKPVILVDGLWLLRKAAIRRLFDLSVFLDCSARTRMKRRLARDVKTRGLSRAVNERIFRKLVEPMNRMYVAPQKRWADVVLAEKWGDAEVEIVVGIVRTLLGDGRGSKNRGGGRDKDGEEEEEENYRARATR